MKKKELIIGTLTGVVLAIGATSFAYQGDPNVQGPNCTPEKHEAMMQAFENQDYSTWKELHEGKGRIADILNEDNFTDFIKMRELKLAGKEDEANQIREKLGLGLGNHKHGQKSGHGNYKNRDNK